MAEVEAEPADGAENADCPARTVRQVLVKAAETSA